MPSYSDIVTTVLDYLEPYTPFIIGSLLLGMIFFGLRLLRSSMMK